MQMPELEGLIRAHGSRMTVEAVNKVACLKGIPIVLCCKCFEPELKTEAWLGDGGWYCRSCGRAERRERWRLSAW